MPAPRPLILLLSLFLLLGLAAPVAKANPLESVVGISTKIRPDARSIGILGRERSGSGVVIDDEGLVLTIGFLVLEADSIEVITAGGRRLPALLVGYHAETGFGLIRTMIRPEVKPARLGSAADLDEGTNVMVGAFATAGGPRPATVVSRRAYAGAWEYLLEDAIFTAPGHPLAQGSGLLDEAGDLLGIGYLNVPPAAMGGARVPGNMFVPIDHLLPVLADLLTEGKPVGERRPWLGVYTGVARGRLVVERTARDGPAAEAGISAGDIVLKIGDRSVSNLEDFYEELWSSAKPGDDVPITVLQGADVRELRVKAIDRYEWFRLSGRSF